MDKYPIPKTCIYCGGPVVLTSNADIYGKEYGNGRCYLCRGCRVYVGVHGDLVTPLGILATDEMRNMKKKCHTAFDTLWKSGNMKRGDAYKELALRMKIPANECHFGWFTMERLRKAYKAVYLMLKDNPVDGANSKFF